MNIAKRFTVATVAIALVSAAVTGLAVNLGIQSTLFQIEQQTRQVETTRLADQVNRKIETLRQDLVVLMRGAPIAELMEATPAGGLPPLELVAETERLFKAEALAKPHYLELRAIGVRDGGRELVRINQAQGGGDVVVASQAEMQRKGYRDFFQKTIVLPPGRIHMSDVDLNVDKGTIQQNPIVPVLRASTPVYGRNGRPLGIAIINVDMAPTLNRIRNLGYPGRSYIVNTQGHYLLHPDPSRDFAFQFGPAARLQDDFPTLAGLPGTRSPRTQRLSGPNGEKIIVTAAPVVLPGGGRMVVISMAPSSGTAISTQARNVILVAALAAGLAGALAAMLVARTVSQPLVQVTDAARAFLQKGDLILPRDRTGEVGVLAETLQRMHETIRDRNQALELQERRLRLMIDASSSAMLMVDHHRIIQLVNATAETTFGYCAHELIGQPIEILVPINARASHPAHVEGFLANPETRAMGAGRDLYGRRKDGMEIPVEIGLSPITMPEGLFTLASIIDITERKGYEDELKRSNAELEQFAYIASHDLQEPLRMVSNYTQLLAEGYRGQLDEKADKYIHYAGDGARRMQQLICDLLSYSRIGSQGAPFAPVTVDEVVADVVQVLQTKIDETGATITFSDLPVVIGDAGQLRQLFQNLLTNAIKFRSDAPPRITITSKSKKGSWIFSVQDNGIGMDMKHAERIFDMFQRLHERGKFEGSGIGLAITRRIVNRHGGEIWLESAPDKGSTFYFTLPAK